MIAFGLEIKKAPPVAKPREWITPSSLHPALRILWGSDSCVAKQGFWSVVSLAIPETKSAQTRVEKIHANSFTIREILEDE